ncbi:MAG: hypothetical protein ACOYXS_08880 [Chloroflexota bacterium]
MSHPALGLPPRDLDAGFPEAAARLQASRSRLSARALEAALAADPTLLERYDELGLRRLLHDAEVYLDQISRAVASADPDHGTHWAEMVHPVYRRRRVPLDDLVTLGEGLRLAIASVLSPAEQAIADRAIDGATLVFRKMRRLGGDARRRNPILAAIYKGA